MNNDIFDELALNPDVDFEAKLTRTFQTARFNSKADFQELESKSVGSLLAKSYLGLCHEFGYGTTIDPARAAILYQEVIAAPQGGTDIAYARLGEMHLTGAGDMPHNLDKAIAYFHQALLEDTLQSKGTLHALYRLQTLSQDHPTLAIVHYYLGMHYRDGSDSTIGRNAAITHFKKAAALHHTDSMYALYHLYQQRHGTLNESNQEEAVAWLFKCLEQPAHLVPDKTIYFKTLCCQAIEPHYELGVCYLKGYGCKKSTKTAKAQFEKAAEANDERAMFALAEMHEVGNYAVKANLQTASHWYKKAAQCNNTQRAFSQKAFAALQRLFPHSVLNDALGECLEYGYGCTKDLVKATDRYMAANELLRIAKTYRDTEAGKIAVKRLSNLAQNHCYDYEYALGLCHEAGFSTPVSPEKAFALFSKVASRVSNPQVKNEHMATIVNLCQLKTAKYYAKGIVVKKDLVHACQLVKEAQYHWQSEPVSPALKRMLKLTKQYPEHPEINYTYGYMLFPKAEAIPYLTNAAAQQDTPAMFLLGSLLETTNMDEAIAWHARAAKAGFRASFEALMKLSDHSSAALIALGECKEAGILVPRDYVAALSYYTRAEVAGNDVAMVKVAQFYLEGREGIAKDLTQALLSLNKALKKNTKHPAGTYAALAIMHSLAKEHTNNARIQHSLAAYYEAIQNKVAANQHWNVATAIEQIDRYSRHISVWRKHADKAYFDVDLKNIPLGEFSAQLRSLRWMHKNLAHQLCQKLHTQRGQFLERGNADPQTLQQYNALIETANVLAITDASSQGLANCAQTLATVSSDFSGDVEHLGTLCARELQFANFIEKLRRNWIHLKYQLETTPWQVSGWFVKWKDGIPDGVAVILEMIKNVETASPHTLLSTHGILSAYITEKMKFVKAEEAAQLDPDKRNRHTMTVTLYQTIHDSLQRIDFHSLPTQAEATPIEQLWLIPTIPLPTPPIAKASVAAPSSSLLTSVSSFFSNLTTPAPTITPTRFQATRAIEMHELFAPPPLFPEKVPEKAPLIPAAPRSTYKLPTLWPAVGDSLPQPQTRAASPVKSRPLTG